MGERNFSEFFGNTPVVVQREKSTNGLLEHSLRMGSLVCDGCGIEPRHLYLKSLAKALPFEFTTEVPIDAKTFVDIDNGKIMAKICKNGFVSKTVSVMPDIVNVRIGGNEVNKVVFVDFADRTTEKAVLSEDDTFSLEQGISICITKKLLNDKCGAGSSMYNKIIQRALKVFDTKEKKEIAKATEKENEEKKFAKIKAKKEARRIKREEAERERQIEIQKEAYLRAMREYNNGTETEQNK